jgi:hypothetical protein
MASSTSLKKGVDGKLWRVLRDMFAKTSSRVRVNDQLSDAFPLAKVGQGTLDAAFDIYIDDLLDCLHECATEDAVALGEALIGPAYADDVAAVSFSPEGLQRHIDTVVAWLRKWRMAANTVKSQTMIIHPANESASVAPEDRAHCWTLDGVVINQVHTSIWGSGSRRMAGGTTMLTRPSIRCAQRMAIGRCWHVPVSRLELLMLQTFVYSAVTYGAEVCTQLMRERMSVVVRRACAPSWDHPMDCSCDALYGDTGLMAWRAHRCGENLLA